MEKSNVDDDCDNTADAFVSSEKGITRMMMMIKHNREPGFLMILSTSLQVLLLFPLTWVNSYYSKYSQQWEEEQQSRGHGWISDVN